MRFDELVEFTRALVQCQSYSGEEGPAIQRCVDEMNRLGFDRVWVNGDGIPACSAVSLTIPYFSVFLRVLRGSACAVRSIWHAEPRRTRREY